MTGLVEFDPHAPFWVGKDPVRTNLYVIYYADQESPMFSAGDRGQGWTDQEHAEAFARKLNGRYVARGEARGPSGVCLVCREPHGEPLFPPARLPDGRRS